MTTRSTLIPLILLASTTVAQAGHSLQEFDKVYATIVHEAVERGIYPKQACFPNYCQTSMDYAYDGANSVIAFRLISKSGLETHEFCIGGDSERRCWFSDGRIVDQFIDGSIWRDGTTIASNFD